MSEKEICWRRFGPKFEKPCGNPEVIECAMWECQERNRCKHLVGKRDGIRIAKPSDAQHTGER